MEKQHLTYFKIENFKRFDSFEMSNLGQFNLIVGDNNVGKTSVLEALTFDENLVYWRSNLQNTTNFRGFFGDQVNLKPEGIKDAEAWKLIFKDTVKPLIVTANSNHLLHMSLSLISYKDLSSSEVETIKKHSISTIPQLWIKQEFHNKVVSRFPQLLSAYFEDVAYLDDPSYIPFIPVNLSYGDDLVDYFYEYINVDKVLKKELEENLKNLIPNLEEVRVHRFSKTHEVLCVTLTNSNGIYPLVRYGDGTVKTTRILMETLLAKNKRFMIDEIGAGIHFLRLKDFWQTIIQLCAQNNTQLFATTHSLECQQAFIEALEEPEMQQYQKDARNISLIENKQGEVKAVTYDFGQFEYALNIGFNTRGGAR
ncbi:AAA family ATPase [Spirosoma linguale]|uniref:ATPase-like protein n=1 Tax=Spirosoma linguale (strain ATCC 33905 / DSM 74 / LMG 10896 / Claus 1) TaxID=504472 RepID=D2QK70_SPILD|nr:ATPase-like protein [Spirosoma linguale DSM 74]